MDVSAAVTTIEGVVTTAAPVMLALIGVSAAIYAFRRIRGLIR